ncbi:hypothetical protein P7B02_18800 [Caulobacter segnis]|uniref:hypothetical protein n=1 Tax=Caulobacter segnis TaxID=88688 RepID=UPI002410513B|nr:hypothetical protein [Caulobacter segnis]MDG2523583.1 hypothetical protein [Caulobacter segnis]
MRLALALTALALADPAQAGTIRPGLWRLTYEALYHPAFPENVATRTVTLVCVGDSTGLDPSLLKPALPHRPTAYLWASLEGDPARAYSISSGGAGHGDPGFVARAKRLGDCRKGWVPSARRVEESKIFPPPTAEEIEAMKERARAKARR